MTSAKVRISPAIVCGPVSGNLEVIDVDTKHWNGIDIIYTSDIGKYSPKLYEKLRIHRTPSGGLHILYRCEHPIGEGSRKLATKKDSKEAGIETRGEGSIALCPPGKGYTVYQDRPIPVLTRNERDSLILIAQARDEKVKVIAEKQYKRENKNFSHHPFEEYNHDSKSENILIDHDWKYFYETNEYIHYTRPGKDTGTSATFDRQKRYFRVFTSSVPNLEPNKGYKASTLLKILVFNGDRKKTIAYLIKQGFGKLKPELEEFHVKKSKSDPNVKIPVNISMEARKQIEANKLSFQKTFCYGKFWDAHEDSRYNYDINRIDLIETVQNMGLRLLNQQLVIVNGNTFKKTNTNEVNKKLLQNYIKLIENPRDQNGIMNAYLTFWKSQGEFILDQVAEIDENTILRSNRKVCYKFFKNGVLSIDEKAKKLIDYSEFPNMFINEEDIIQRNWNYIEPNSNHCKYKHFVHIATNISEELLHKIIGYLGNDFKDETQYWIIALTEVIKGTVGGRTGKGLFMVLLGDRRSRTDKGIDKYKWSNLLVRDLSNTKNLKKEEILQSWNGEQLLHLNDIPKNFSFSHLKAMSAEGTEVKKLYKDLKHVEAKDMPKIVTSSQWGLNLISDPGVASRVVQLPFSDHFNSDYTPIEEYGGKIPDVWSDTDWNGYYSFIADCVQLFIKEGLKLNVKTNISNNSWLKNFDIVYCSGDGDFRTWIEDNIEDWTQKSFISANDLKELYNIFTAENNIIKKLTFSKLHEALEQWCHRHGWNYESGKRKWIHDKQVRVSVFTQNSKMINSDSNEKIDA